MVSHDTTSERFSTSTLSTSPFAGWSSRARTRKPANKATDNKIAAIFIAGLTSTNHLATAANLFSTQSSGLALQLRIVLCKFLDGNELILAHVGKLLPGIGRRPPHIQCEDTRTVAQTDVLLQRVNTEGTGVAHGTVDGPRSPPVILNRDLDLRPPRRAVTLHSAQPDVDPVVVISRILEDTHRVLIGGHRATCLGKDIFMTRSLQIGEDYPVPLMQFARSRRGGDIDEALAVFVAHENVRRQRSE